MFGPPDPQTPLSAYPWVVIRFRCHYCKRAGDSRLAYCAERYGANATLERLLDIFVSRCPHDPRNPARKQKYGNHCGAYLPDIGASGPPDLPPAMSGLTLIDGGKDDMLPAESRREERRRRIGGKDE